MMQKKTVKGIGYTTIYFSKLFKFELSVQETVMRKTIYRYRRPEERLYFRVTDWQKIDQIEYKSEKWKVYNVHTEYPYIILEQRDFQNKLTGHYKIIRKNRADVVSQILAQPEVYVRYSRDDWMYFERRTQKNEI